MRDFRAEITEQIIKLLETDGLKWLRKWRTDFPMSLTTGKQYKGINVLMLAYAQQKHSYNSNLWVTFNEVRKRGGQVRKGEKSQMVVYFQMREVKELKDGQEEIKQFPLMRYSNVFNVEQTTLEIKTEAKAEVKPIEEAEKIVESYKNKPEIKFNGFNQPSYVSSADVVQMPKRENFADAESFYATLFHELAHSTGHEKRLNRKLSAKFGSESYAFEELVAELSSAFLCAKAHIEGEGLQNNTAYIKSWLEALRNDKTLIFKASREAQNVFDYVVGEVSK